MQKVWTCDLQTLDTDGLRAMKWFKLDTDMPDDPRIREVIQRLGNEGLGALVRIWCFVGNHGVWPGISLDRNRQPMQKQALIEASGLSKLKFTDLMVILSENGHIKKNRYRKHGVVVFPAMCRRADPYTRRSVRTHSAQSAHFVPLEEKRSREENIRRAHAREGSRRSPVSSAQNTTPTGSFCPHVPRCDTFTTCTARIITEARAERSRDAVKKR